MVDSVTFGLHIGGEATEMIMVATNQKAIDSLLSSSRLSWGGGDVPITRSSITGKAPSMSISLPRICHGRRFLHPGREISGCGDSPRYNEVVPSYFSLSAENGKWARSNILIAVSRKRLSLVLLLSLMSCSFYSFIRFLVTLWTQYKIIAIETKLFLINGKTL